MGFLTELLVYQKCSLIIQSSENGELQGDFLILVGGQPHQLSVQATTIEGIVTRVQYEYLRHDWSAVEVPVVEVRSGMAEVVSGNATIIDFDNLASNNCPSCEGHLGTTGAEDRECPGCHYAWAEGDK